MKIFAVILLIFLQVQLIYQLLWIFVTPFVPEEHTFQQYFPNRKYAFIFPSFIIVSIIISVLGYLGYILINSEKYSQPIAKPWEKIASRVN